MARKWISMALISVIFLFFSGFAIADDDDSGRYQRKIKREIRKQKKETGRYHRKIKREIRKLKKEDRKLHRRIDNIQQTPGPTYTGIAPINVDNDALTIGLNSATFEGDLLTWDAVGNNWVATLPEDAVMDISIMQPYLGVNFIISKRGTVPDKDSPLTPSPFVGQITMFAGDFEPGGWAFCNGQLLAIADNPALFEILGTTYGGDGETTFALPDLRGRAPLHPGTGPGLTERRLGEKGGAETH